MSVAALPLASAAERQYRYPDRTMSPEEFAEHVRTSVDPKWVRPGAAVDEILSVERRLRMRLSDEMRAFYGCVGGTDEPTPLEEGWMTFWPLERWERAATFTKNSDADLVVVADHSLSSWVVRDTERGWCRDAGPCRRRPATAARRRTIVLGLCRGCLQ